MKDVAVVILTRNEQLHIRRCIESVTPFAQDVFIVDSGSTDATIEIAKALGAKVYLNPWVNYATQLNWAIDNLPIKSRWVMRLDADETVTPELAAELLRDLSKVPDDCCGLYVKRRVIFMDRWIRHGGYYPTWLLRFWRTGSAACEMRWMDEHIKLNRGTTARLRGDIVDENKKDLTWWTEKHNQYASREAIDLLNLRHHIFPLDRLDSGSYTAQERIKRWMKESVYARMPASVRALAYFLYRYFVRLGFLDGRQGLIFHFLQGFWYRFLVDAKVYEVERRASELKLDVRTTLEQVYGVKVAH